MYIFMLFDTVLCMYVCMYIYICVCVCVCVCECVYVEVQIDLIRDGVVGIVTGPWNKRLRNRGWAPEIHHFSHASRRRLGSTQPPMQWTPAAFPPG